MKAMILDRIDSIAGNKNPLRMIDLPMPVPKEKEVLIKLTTCGVCHTELDEIEGRMRPPRLPVVPGHQAVGEIVEVGSKASKFKVGDRVGVAWIFSACGKCKYCLSGRENLCENFMATGRDVNGGYAEYMTVSQDFAHLVPECFTDAEAAPLLCAGAIGYRSLRLANIIDGRSLGLTGFGASGHLVMKMAAHMYPHSRVYVFARSAKEREFALELGAVWAGETEEQSPEKLECIIDTTPVWKPVVEALSNLDAGGRLIINAIRKEDADKDYLLRLDYAKHLWLEKEIKSIANVERRDVSEFLEVAAEIPLKPAVQKYNLEDANQALVELKEGRIQGAKVLVIS